MDEFFMELVTTARDAIFQPEDKPNRIENIYQTMCNLYSYVADHAPVLNTYQIFEMNDGIRVLEDFLKEEFLPLKNSPDFDAGKTVYMPMSIRGDNNKKQVLDYIVHNARTKLCVDNALEMIYWPRNTKKRQAFNRECKKFLTNDEIADFARLNMLCDLENMVCQLAQMRGLNEEQKQDLFERARATYNFYIKKEHFQGKCGNGAFLVSNICRELNLKSQRFMVNENLQRGSFTDGYFHCFSIVDVGNKSYIVDTTYRQFFCYAQSFLEQTELPDRPGCRMGRFMMMSDERQKFAEQLLSKGYIEATPENIKHYFDAFVLSGRNGLYYQNLNKETITPEDFVLPYTYIDYLMALKTGKPIESGETFGKLKSSLNKRLNFVYGKFKSKQSGEDFGMN